jgi:hypothetical protein
VSTEYFIIIFFWQLKFEKEYPLLLQATPSQPGGKGGVQEGRSFTIFKPYIADSHPSTIKPIFNPLTLKEGKDSLF